MRAFEDLFHPRVRGKRHTFQRNSLNEGSHKEIRKESAENATKKTMVFRLRRNRLRRKPIFFATRFFFQPTAKTYLR